MILELGVNLALVAPPQSWLGQGSGFGRREGKSTNWKPGFWALPGTRTHPAKWACPLSLWDLGFLFLG